MKRKVIVTGMLAFALIALIAPQKAQAQKRPAEADQMEWKVIVDFWQKKGGEKPRAPMTCYILAKDPKEAEAKALEPIRAQYRTRWEIKVKETCLNTPKTLGKSDINWGKWEFTVQINSWRRAKYIVNAATYEEANAMALAEAMKEEDTDKKSRVLWADTIREPVNTAFAKARQTGENVLDILSKSTEFAGIIAQLKKLEKVVGKLGVAGKTLQGIDAMNDFAKIVEYVQKSKTAETQSAKDDYLHEVIAICAKLTKTAVTTAFPPAGYIDLGISTISKVYTSISQMKLDAKQAAKKAEYDKHKYRLYQHEAWYESEWRMYAAGISMDDIIELRRERWKQYWDPTGIKHISYSNPASDTGVYHNLTKYPIVPRK
jgi:hypothetical protein